MTNDALKAAVERIRRLNDQDDVFEVYGSRNVDFQMDVDKDLIVRAYFAEHPADAPDWYSRAEMFDWLRRMNYSEQIANELAELIATNYQLAFNKGFSMGQQKAQVPSADDAAPVTTGWLEDIGFTMNPLHRGCFAIACGDDAFLAMRTINCTWVYGSTGLPDQKTRGDVRRLCAALGIPLGVT